MSLLWEAIDGYNFPIFYQEVGKLPYGFLASLFDEWYDSVVEPDLAGVLELRCVSHDHSTRERKRVACEVAKGLGFWMYCETLSNGVFVFGRPVLGKQCPGCEFHDSCNMKYTEVGDNCEFFLSNVIKEF